HLASLSAGAQSTASVCRASVLAYSRRPPLRRRSRLPYTPLFRSIAASGRRVALIAGADLAHVGPRFGDPEPVSPAEPGQLGRRRSEEHTSELQSPDHLVCRLLLEIKKTSSYVCVLLF